MGTCKVCGKNGFFLKINSDGRCKNCERKFQEDLLRKQEELQQALIQKRQLEEENLRHSAQNYCARLSSMLTEIKSEIETSDDPIVCLNDLPKVQAKIELCDSFLTLIDQYRDFKYFVTIIQDNITYKSSTDKNIHYGYIPEFSMSIWTNRDNYIDSFVNDLKSLVNQYKRGWTATISRIKSNAEFQNELLSIEDCPVELIDSTIQKLNVSDIRELKLSNITAKTNYEKIGTFVVIDTETTGLNCGQHSIIEIAAILFENWKPKLKFETLLKPSAPIPYDITNLTGITNDMVACAPRFAQIADSLLKFISSYNLVGHNLTFDLKFLYKNGLDFYSKKRKYFDTLSISQKVLKKPSYKWDKDLESYEINYDRDYDVENHKLDTLCDYYSIRDNDFAHRALSDAYATGILFQKLVKERIM